MSASTQCLLCIESSGLNCGVALYVDGRLQSLSSHWISNIHDKLLASMCAQMLEANGMSVSSLSAIAISAGPGSFTGLRIGASLVKALCYDNQPKLIAVPTLEAIAWAAAERALLLNYNSVFVVVGAQSGKYYVQHFAVTKQHDDNGQASASASRVVEGAESVPQTSQRDRIKLKALADARFLSEVDLVASLPADTFIVGPAAPRFGSLSESDVLARLDVLHLRTLALQLLQREQWTDVDAFQPLYVQDFVPQVVPRDYLL